MELGFFVGMYTPEAAANIMSMYGAIARPPYVGPYEYPTQAMVDVLISARQATTGSVRIDEVSRDRNWNGGMGENAVFTNTMAGERCLANLLTAPTGQGAIHAL